MKVERAELLGTLSASACLVLVHRLGPSMDTDSERMEFHQFQGLWSMPFQALTSAPIADCRPGDDCGASFDG